MSRDYEVINNGYRDLVESSPVTMEALEEALEGLIGVRGNSRSFNRLETLFSQLRMNELRDVPGQKCRPA